MNICPKIKTCKDKKVFMEDSLFCGLWDSLEKPRQCDIKARNYNRKSKKVA